MEINESFNNNHTGLLNTSYSDVRNNASEILDKNLRFSVTEVQIIYIVIGIFGILGNGFSTAVFISSKKMRRNLTDQFLIFQGMTDFLASLFIIANTVTIKKTSDLHGVLGYMRCVLWDSSLMVWGTFLASTYNLAAVSIEKWLQIVYPLQHKVYFDQSKAYIMMGAAWLFAYIYQMSYLIATSNVIEGECYTLAFWHSPLSKKIFGLITFIAKYLAPVCTICACYTSMFLVLRRKRNMTGRTRKGHDKFEKAQANVLRTLIIIVVCFLLCVSWNQIMFLFHNLGVFRVDFTAWWYHATVIGYFLNCCVNPFVYVTQYKEFRQSMSKLIYRNRVNSSTVVSSVTRSYQININNNDLDRTRVSNIRQEI